MANPPVCRIMDYGKFRYEESQKAKESRKKTIQVSIKEVKFRPKIGKGDFDTKVRHMQDFLAEGHKVKVTLQFRGREMAHPELGSKILDAVIEQARSARQGRDAWPAGRTQHDDGAGTGEEGSRQEAARTERQRHTTTTDTNDNGCSRTPHAQAERCAGAAGSRSSTRSRRRSSSTQQAPAEPETRSGRRHGRPGLITDRHDRPRRSTRTSPCPR